MAVWKKRKDGDDGKHAGGSGWSLEAESGGEWCAAAQSPGPAVDAAAGGPRPEQLIQRFGQIDSALAAGTVIQGKLSFDSPVRVDGQMGGELYSASAVIVGRTAKIDATIVAPVVVIMGEVQGRVEAGERVELLSGGRVEAVIKTPALLVETGAILNGACDMPVPKSTDEARVPAASEKLAS